MRSAQPLRNRFEHHESAPRTRHSRWTQTGAAECALELMLLRALPEALTNRLLRATDARSRRPTVSGLRLLRDEQRGDDQYLGEGRAGRLRGATTARQLPPLPRDRRCRLRGMSDCPSGAIEKRLARPVGSEKRRSKGSVVGRYER